MAKGSERKMRKKACYAKELRRANYDVQEMLKAGNIIKDYANFLSAAPLQMFNLKPNDEGIVSATLKDLANYNQVYIVAVDPDSATQMSIPVTTILEQANEAIKSEIPMRDLA